MEWKQKLEALGVKQFLKLLAFAIAVLFVLWVGINLLSESTGLSMSNDSISGFAPSAGINSASYDKGGYSERMAKYPSAPTTGSVGNDAEDFEVKDYTVGIETRDKDEMCGVVYGLKQRPEVVFEQSQVYDTGCSYVFKVVNKDAAAILTLVESLDPKTLNEQSYTIKSEITYYADEVVILENKLASLDKTLAEAIASYESLSQLATEVGDVESLVKVIDSKLMMIERLTNARIEASNRLDVMNKAKAESLDKTTYTYFRVTVYESVFVDTEAVFASWKSATQQFVRDTNVLLQDITIGFISFLLLVVKFSLYFVVLILVARYGWRFGKTLWRSDQI